MGFHFLRLIILWVAVVPLVAKAASTDIQWLVDQIQGAQGQTISEYLQNTSGFSEQDQKERLEFAENLGLSKASMPKAQFIPPNQVKLVVPGQSLILDFSLMSKDIMQFNSVEYSHFSKTNFKKVYDDLMKAFSGKKAYFPIWLRPAWGNFLGNLLFVGTAVANEYVVQTSARGKVFNVAPKDVKILSFKCDEKTKTLVSLDWRLSSGGARILLRLDNKNEKVILSGYNSFKFQKNLPALVKCCSDKACVRYLDETVKANRELSPPSSTFQSGSGAQ